MSQEPVQTDSGRPHLEVTAWLKALKLEQYDRIFNRYGGVEDLLDLDGQAVIDLGIRNSTHRTSIVTSLKLLNAKYKKALASKSDKDSAALAVTGLHKENSELNSLPCEQIEMVATASDMDSNSNFTCLTGKYGTENKESHVLDYEENTVSRYHGKPLTEGTKRLEDQTWYHGNVTRLDAQKLMKENGQFLVRDCISSPGDYVLTCCWNNVPLHFMINRLQLSKLSSNNNQYETGDHKVVYQFEEEQFSNIVDLIDFYVTHLKPITVQSLCVISIPVQYCHVVNLDNDSILNQENGNIPSGNALISIPPRLSDDTDPGGYEVMNRKLPDAMPFPPKRAGLKNLTIPNPDLAKRPLPPTPPSVVNSKSGKSPKMPLSQRVMLMEASKSMSKSSSESKLFEGSPLSRMIKTGLSHFNSATNLNSCSKKYLKTPPCKPTRAPSLKKKDKPMIIVRGSKGGFSEIPAVPENDEGHDYCDIDYDEMDHDYSEPEDKNVDRPETEPTLTNGPPNLPPRVVDRDSACVADFNDYDSPKRSSSPVEPVNLNVVSKIAMQSFCSILLASENKPLDSNIWKHIEEMLLNSDPALCAKLLTKEDCRFLDFYKNVDYGAGVNLSLGLLLLPQGQLLRTELLERASCLSYFVSATILKGADADRKTKILNLWIKIANCLKTQQKNWFALPSVMKGLQSYPIQNLASCWSSLRIDFTETAVCFETSLRPFLMRLEQADPTLQDEEQNTCTVPYLHPMLRLMEGAGCIGNKDLKLFDWEDFDSFYGLDALCEWLATSRLWSEYSEVLEKRIELIFQNSNSEKATEIEELFQTPFHLKFLWGARGATVNAKVRHPKLEKLLDIMSDKWELEVSKDKNVDREMVVESIAL